MRACGGALTTSKNSSKLTNVPIVFKIFGIDMIDRALLRQEPEKIKSLVLKKEPNFDIDSLIALDQQTRALTSEVEKPLTTARM